MSAADEFHHDQMLLRALHRGLPVTRAGLSQFVHTIRAQRSGGGVETEVYLVGDPVPHPSNEITFQEQPE